MASVMTDGDVLFSLEDASAGYGGPPVLSGIDLEIRRGERIAIMGRSGAGKSTLLSLLYDRRPDDIALIPQAAALVKPLSVFHNVYMGRLDRHHTAYNLRNLVWPHPAEVTAVRRVLDLVQLDEKLFEPAGALSGGQQQRVSVARALFNGRSIVLGDEPVSALDRVQGSDVLDVMRSRGGTLVMVLHDVHLALAHAERIVFLADGRKVLDAPSADLEAADLLAQFGGEP
jgi:phosphonate transport system ATP-binding protein